MPGVAATARYRQPMAEGDRGGRFDSLAIPTYRRLIIGGTFTFLAMQITMIARAWLAFELTGTNTALGGVVLGFGVASIVAIPTGGVVADRFPKRTVLVVTGCVQTIVSLAIASAVASDAIAYWMLIVAGVLQGAAISLLAPARLAFIADLVDRDRLTNAVLLGMSSMQLTRMIGPAIAGTLIGIETIGISGVYYIGAGASAIGLLLVIGLPDGRPRHKSDRTPIEDLIDGVRFVRSTPLLSHLIVFSFLVVLFGFPHIVFLPVLAEEIFDAGSVGFGALTTAAAVGAFISSLALANTVRSRLRAIQTAAAFGFGLFLVAFAVAPTFAAALIAIAFVGAAAASFQALNNSLILTLAPVEYHGRVQSLLMLSFTGFGLAALPMGLLADTVGLRLTLALMGGAIIVVGLWSIWWMRRLAAHESGTLW